VIWFIIGIIFSLLIVVAFFGDHEEKDRKRDYEKYWEIVKGDKK